jgi:hypothetical protein
MAQRGGGASEPEPDVRTAVQRQLARAVFQLSVEFRREQTRFLNKMEAQRGLEMGSSIGVVERDDDAGGGAGGGSGIGALTSAQVMRVAQSESLIDERDQEIRKVGAGCLGVLDGNRRGVVWVELGQENKQLCGFVPLKQRHPTTPNAETKTRLGTKTKGRRHHRRAGADHA